MFTFIKRNIAPLRTNTAVRLDPNTLHEFRSKKSRSYYSHEDYMYKLDVVSTRRPAKRREEKEKEIEQLT